MAELVLDGVQEGILIGSAVSATFQASAGEAQGKLRAFGVAAEPEQIVGGAGGKGARNPADRSFAGFRKQRDGPDRRIRLHPDIAGATAILHGKGARVVAFGDPAEPAGHNRPTIGGARQKDPQAEGTGHKRSIAGCWKGWHGRKAHAFLADAFFFAQRHFALASKQRAVHRKAGPKGVQTDRVTMGLVCLGAHRRITAPPGGDVG